MPASHQTPVRRALLATLAAAALVCDVSPSSAAEIIGTPKNSTSAAAQIAACSVTIDPENANAFPVVKLAAAPSAGSPPVSAQVELDLHDALGAGDDTRVIVVGVAKSDVPLASYPVNGNYVGLGCHIRTITLADGTVQTVASGGGAGGGSSSGATLGILGGLLLVGGIAAAAGHGGSSSGGQSPSTPTPTPPVTHPASPTPTPSPSPLPTATPTASPVPTPSPIPTPTASPTAGALVITPQSLTFIATGPSYAKSTQASETNYKGAFMASPASCTDSNGTGTTVASISPATTSSGLFTVTPLGAGACTFSITDSLGDLQTLSIGVTTTGGTVMTHKKKIDADPRPTPSPSPSPNPRPAGNAGGPPPHH